MVPLKRVNKLRKRLYNFWRWFTAPSPNLIPSLIVASIALFLALVVLRLVFG